MQHVTHLRMRHACSLLLLSEQKLLAVASAVGYDNAFAFSVAFKRHIDVAPAGYRKARMRPQM